MSTVDAYTDDERYLISQALAPVADEVLIAMLSGSHHLGYADAASDIDVDVVATVDATAVLLGERLGERRLKHMTDGKTCVEVVVWPYPKVARLIAAGDPRLTLAFGYDPTCLTYAWPRTIDPLADLTRLAQASLTATSTQHRIAHLIANQLTGYLMNRELNERVACTCAVRAAATMRVALAVARHETPEAPDEATRMRYQTARTSLEAADALVEECDGALAGLVYALPHTDDETERARLLEEAARIVYDILSVDWS